MAEAHAAASPATQGALYRTWSLLQRGARGSIGLVGGLLLLAIARLLILHALDGGVGMGVVHVEMKPVTGSPGEIDLLVEGEARSTGFRNPRVVLEGEGFLGSAVPRSPVPGYLRVEFRMDRPWASSVGRALCTHRVVRRIRVDPTTFRGVIVSRYRRPDTLYAFGAVRLAPDRIEFEKLRPLVPGSRDFRLTAWARLPGEPRSPLILREARFDWGTVTRRHPRGPGPQAAELILEAALPGAGVHASATTVTTSEERLFMTPEHPVRFHTARGVVLFLPGREGSFQRIDLEANEDPMDASAQAILSWEASTADGLPRSAR